MADLLKFRKGTLAQINSAEKVAGTIYIAKDEKAMYVDVDASTRIRIGDFIRVAKIADITFPYSETALYYVEEDNALVCYQKDAEGNGSWKQINSFAGLAERLTAAEESIANLRADLGNKTDGSAVDTAFGRIAKNTADIRAHENYVGTIPEGAEATSIVAYIQEKTSGIASDTALTELTTRVTQAEKDVDALEGTVSGHTDSISTLNGQVATKAEKSYVDDTFVTKTDASATYVTKTEFNDAKTAISSEIDADVKVEADRAVAAEGALSGRIKTLEDAGYQDASQVGSAIDTKIAAAKVDISKEIDDDVAALKTEVAKDYATKGELNAVDATVSGHTAAIGTINETLATKATKDYVDETFVKKTDADAKLAKIDTTKTVSEAIADAVAAEATLREAADTTHTSAISKLQSDLADVKTTADAAVTNDKLTNAIKNFATTDDVNQAKADAVADAKTAGDLAYAAKDIENTVASHTGDLTTLKGAATVAGSVAEAKKAGDDALALIGDANGGLTKTVNDHTAALEILNGADSVNGSVANAKKVGTEAATQAKTNRQAIATLKGTVDKLDGTVETEGSVKKQIKDAVDAAKTALSAEIDADIRAANAMEYAGTIESASGLPATAKNGATYVVGAAFGNYAAGDMLIAQGDENPDTGLITNPTWAHVKSGYDASLDQKLTGADNAIKLSTGTGNAGTQVAFAATGSASVTVADNTVTVGMVWEDF